MTGINLNDDQLNTIIAKAILDSLTPERRAELIEGAVKALLAKPVNADRYGETRSAMQVAFDSAVRNTAEKLVSDELTASTEFRAKVEQLFRDVAAKLFDNPDAYGSLTSKMAAAISSNLTSTR